MEIERDGYGIRAVSGERSRQDRCYIRDIGQEGKEEKGRWGRWGEEEER